MSKGKQSYVMMFHVVVEFLKVQHIRTY